MKKLQGQIKLLGNRDLIGYQIEFQLEKNKNSDKKKSL